MLLLYQKFYETYMDQNFTIESITIDIVSHLWCPEHSFTGIFFNNGGLLGKCWKMEKFSRNASSGHRGNKNQGTFMIFPFILLDIAWPYFGHLIIYYSSDSPRVFNSFGGVQGAIFATETLE